MNKFVLYSIFFILSLGVVISLLFTFKYIKVDVKDLISKNSYKKSDNMLYSDEYKTELEKSWLSKIQLEYKDEPYFYAVNEVKIVLN